MSILHLISQDGHIVLNKQLIKLFGFYEAGIVGLFASVHNYNQLTISDYDGWFYVTYEKIENNLSLTEEKAKNPINKLEKAGVFYTKKRGVPCRKFFKFNQDRLLQLLVPSSSGKIQLQEAGKSSFKKRENLMTRRRKKPAQEEGKTGRNNKTNKKTLSLSEMEKFAEERDLKIDVKKFYEWCCDEESLKASWKNIMKIWAKKPENQIKTAVLKNHSVLESSEITEIRSKIKFTLGNQFSPDAIQHFNLHDIEKNVTGFVVKKITYKALQYAEVLKTINVEIK